MRITDFINSYTEESKKKGLYYYINKRKKAGTSRSKNNPKAPSAQDWKNAAKTAKKEGIGESVIPWNGKAVVVYDSTGANLLDTLDINVAAQKYGLNANDIRNQLKIQQYTKLKGPKGEFMVSHPMAPTALDAEPGFATESDNDHDLFSNRRRSQQEEPSSPVASSIIRRIMLQRPDLLSHGPEAVGNAVDEVADWVGDVDEIGSSDVSGWVRQVERILQDNQDVTEDSSDGMSYRAAYVAGEIEYARQTGQPYQFEPEEDNPQFKSLVTKYLQQYGQQGMAEGSLEEVDRRGFLKGMGAAAVAGAAGGGRGLGEQSVLEAIHIDIDLVRAVFYVAKEIYDGAKAGNDMTDTIADELGDYFDDVEQSGLPKLKKAYAAMHDTADEDPSIQKRAAGNALLTLNTLIRQGTDRLRRQGVAEGFNGEYDDEAGMADNNLETMKRSVDGLDSLIHPGDNLPEWCQEKIAVAKSMLVTVWDYMASEEQSVSEEWSQKYKNSINCSHPKGFSQKAHCAGKKKHNESMMTMEATCPDCGLCQTHGSLNEIKKGQKDANGYTRCWPGKHAEGTKKGKNGGQVRNCEPNESVTEQHDDEFAHSDRAANEIAVGKWRRGGEMTGTSLKGYIETTYEQLEGVLGEPVYGPNESDADKITCEWVITFQDGTVATVYDWKVGETPMDLYSWHIGGNNNKSKDYIGTLMRGKGDLKSSIWEGRTGLYVDGTLKRVFESKAIADKLLPKARTWFPHQTVELLAMTEDATGGSSCSSSVGAVMTELGAGDISKRQLNSKLGKYTNISRKPKQVRVKGGY